MPSIDRRTLVAGAAGSAGLAATTPAFAQMLAGVAADAAPLPSNPPAASGARYRPPHRFGMGGTQVSSNHFHTPLHQAIGTIEAAWANGVRFFDTSPWYGLGLSERRFGTFFDKVPREELVVSTKIGRLLVPDASVAGTQVSNWAQVPPMRHEYDYTAEGTRRSIEQSLQRMGLASIDIVFVHDLSPDNPDMGERWPEYFAQAERGAFPELTRMREEGLIKGWGMGVNELEPAIRSFEVADPDILLQATQYSLAKHEEALERLFPVVAERGASIVIGAPLNDGFLAGGQRFNYGPIPEDLRMKRARLAALAQEHDTDLRTAALHFALAPAEVSAIIPGARSPTQAMQNAASIRESVPAGFWDACRAEGLIATGASVPA